MTARAKIRGVRGCSFALLLGPCSVYVSSSNAYSLQLKTVAPFDVDNQSYHGLYIAIDRDVIVADALNNSDFRCKSGSVCVHTQTKGEWKLLSKLVPEGSYHYGLSIAIDNNIAIIGDP